MVDIELFLKRQKRKEQKERYRLLHPDKWKASRKRHKERQEERTKEMVFDYKKDKCCSNCGYNEHPEILQFHHLNPQYKEKNLSQIKYVTRAKEEMKKCILLCPNCHFWLHHLEVMNKK